MQGHVREGITTQVPVVKETVNLGGESTNPMKKIFGNLKNKASHV